MEEIWADATHIPFTGAESGTYAGGAFRGVLHTTEAKYYHPSATDYYGHKNPPHFTLVVESGQPRMYQHYPITRSARALENPLGGVETNRRSAIQIEIAWTAATIGELPDGMVAKLKSWMRWVEQEAGVKLRAPKFHGSEAYGSGSVSRMSSADWNAFDGWCRHPHVPENNHWHPGLIDN